MASPLGPKLRGSKGVAVLHEGIQPGELRLVRELRYQLVQLAQMHGVTLERVGFSTVRWLALTMSGLKPRSTGR